MRYKWDKTMYSLQAKFSSFRISYKLIHKLRPRLVRTQKMLFINIDNILNIFLSFDNRIFVISVISGLISVISTLDYSACLLIFSIDLLKWKSEQKAIMMRVTWSFALHVGVGYSAISFLANLLIYYSLCHFSFNLWSS